VSMRCVRVRSVRKVCKGEQNNKRSFFVFIIELLVEGDIRTNL
jgi:hypothetical protein